MLQIQVSYSLLALQIISAKVQGNLTKKTMQISEFRILLRLVREPKE